MNVDQQRQEAVFRYMAGEKIAAIARSVGKSRKWLHHWIKRYEQRSEEGLPWYQDESKAPKTVVKTSVDTETHVLQIRKELATEKMAQIGAISIQYECSRRGISPPPPIWTINRILAKHGLSKVVCVRKDPKEYPQLFCHTHQMDLIGPRYIKGDGRFYSINLIDTVTHSCFTHAVRTKSSANIVQTIATFWETHGMPDALQMDNELAFRGSNRYPRSFGSVVRFALSCGVAPIFIPVKEPWRNGMMEKFNDTYQKRFLKANIFSDFEDLCKREKDFIAFHNAYHRYSSQSHQTPDIATANQLPPILYNGTQHLPSKDQKVHIPLVGGSIYYIRFIRSDLKLSITNESFTLLPTLKYSYVIAEVNIDNQCLIVRQNGEIKQVFAYYIDAISW